MADKEKIHQILSSLWKNDDSVGKMCYNQALQDVQTAIDLQEEPKTDWLQELQKRLDSLSKEDLKKVFDKYAIDFNEEPVKEDYKIYGSVAAVKALDRKRVCPQLKGNTLHKFKNEFNTIKQIVHLLYDYEDPFCYRVALHWASWGAYNLKSFGNINEKEKAKMDISEEPVSEDLEKASKEWLEPQLDKSYDRYGEGKMMELTHFDGYAMLDAIEFGAKWKHEQMMKNAIEGEWWRCAVVLPAKYMNTDDIRSVKIIIIENN